MKSAVLLCTVFITTLAKPNGFYHQEYNYRTSSSSYKNNELQHQNDDEGHYAKAGDLEGRFRPRVDSHSQHSEYVNPKLQHGYQMGTDRTSSFGQLNAQDRLRSGEFGYGGQDMGGGYGYVGGQNVGGQNYGMNSDLRQVTASLQQEMERELQRAVYDHYQRTAAYGGAITQAQIETDRRSLEEELRRNMTMRLQDVLKVNYGNQGVRGAYSYSIINGRLQPTANYNNQELVDLKRQMEENLMRQLNQQVQTYYHTRVDTRVHTQRNTYGQVNGVGDNYPSALEQRPVFRPQPFQPEIQPHPIQPHSVQPYPIQPHQIQPHPVAPIPDSITTVATRVQTELNEILNKLLEDTQRRYFSENSFQAGVDYDRVLAHLQDELRTNITFHFDDQIKRTYGYSNYASKYSVQDLENLRRQIETNLITKLNRDFNRQREKFFQSRRMYVVTQPFPANQVYYPVHPVNNVNNVNYQRELLETQRQLQEQMSRQLQTALMQHSYRQAHMYSGSSSNFNAQAQYQATLDQLAAELNRNLTRQMEMLNVQQFQNGAYASQLANMKQQLQSDLMRQLQQGLQQTYSRYSSWSSSSSSSSSSGANYRPVRGFDPNIYQNYGTSGNVGTGEDCMMGDDPSVYQQQTDSDEDLTQQVEDLTQQNQDDADLTQQTEDLTQQAQDVTQQVENEDLTQQTQNIRQHVRPGYSRPLQRVETHDDLTQQTQDLTQQSQTQDDLEQPIPTQYVVGQPEYVKPPPKIVYVGREPQQSHQQTTDDIEPIYQRQNTNQLYSRPQQVTPLRPVPIRYHRYRDQDLTQQSQDLTQQTQDLTHQSQDLTQQSQDLTRPLKPIPNRYDRYRDQDLTQQTQDFTQQSQDATQQSQKLTRPLKPIPNRYYRYRDQHLTQQTQDLTQQSPDLTQQPQDLTQQTQVVDTPTQPIFTQTNPIYRGHRYQTYEYTRHYEAPRQYTSTYTYTPQRTGNRVGQRVEYYENLQRPRYPSAQQTSVVSSYKPVSQQEQIGQQTEDSSLGQQVLLGQVENDDLTQQVQNPGFGQLIVGNQQPSGLDHQIQQSEDLTQQNQDLTQQTEDSEFTPLQLGSGSQIRQQENSNYIHYTTVPLRRPGQVESLDQQLQNGAPLAQQQAEVFVTQQNHDLGQQTEQNLDLGQQAQDLTQQTQDLTQQNEDLTQQTEDLTQSQDLTQQTEDLTQQIQNQDLEQAPQTQYVIGPPAEARVPPAQRYEVQQVQDLTQQKQNQQLTRDLTQVEDIDQPIEPEISTNKIFKDEPSRQQLAQQTQDLIQQEIEHNQQLSQQNQHLTQQTEDLTQQNRDVPQRNEDLTHHDLTQQTEDLTQQSEDLTQQSQDVFDHEPQTQHVISPDVEAHIPQLQRYEAQHTEDLTQQNEDLTQQNQDLTQKTEDLTQQNPNRTQQSKDLTQQTEDLIQQNEDLTQQTEDLTQQTEDLTQQTEDLKINQDEVRTEQPTTIPPLLQQNNVEQVSNQQRLNEAERQSQNLIELLRNQQNQGTQQNYHSGPIYYSPRPVYADHDGHPVQVGTTRQIQPTQQVSQDTEELEPIAPYQYKSRPVYSSSYGQQHQIGTTRQLPNGRSTNSEVNYPKVEVGESEHVGTVHDIEPIQPQVAHEVEEVEYTGPVEPEEVELFTTTQKPGFWKRFKTSIKNKIG